MIRIHIASSSSCSVLLVPSIAAHHRALCDLLVSACFDGAFEDVQILAASLDGSRVVWVSPPETALTTLTPYALAHGLVVETTCTLCRASRCCPVHGEVSL